MYYFLQHSGKAKKWPNCLTIISFLANKAKWQPCIDRVELKSDIFVLLFLQFQLLLNQIQEGQNAEFNKKNAGDRFLTRPGGKTIKLI